VEIGKMANGRFVILKLAKCKVWNYGIGANERLEILDRINVRFEIFAIGKMVGLKIVECGVQFVVLHCFHVGSTHWALRALPPPAGDRCHPLSVYKVLVYISHAAAYPPLAGEGREAPGGGPGSTQQNA
jgi:hypothetical protein